MSCYVAFADREGISVDGTDSNVGDDDCFLCIWNGAFSSVTPFVCQWLKKKQKTKKQKQNQNKNNVNTGQ